MGNDETCRENGKSEQNCMRRTNGTSFFVRICILCQFRLCAWLCCRLDRHYVAFKQGAAVPCLTTSDPNYLAAMGDSVAESAACDKTITGNVHTCSTCAQVLSSQKELSEHQVSCGAARSSAAVTAAPKGANGTTDSGSKPTITPKFECEGCGRQFSAFASLRGHRRRNGRGVLYCSIRPPPARGAAVSGTPTTPAPPRTSSRSRYKARFGRRSQSLKRKKSSISHVQRSYKCQYCRHDITDGPRIHCVECKQTTLCLKCFAAGKANTPHAATHAYRVNFNNNHQLLDVGWDINQELEFVEGLKHLGVGNWTEISEIVGKTETQCRRHFEDVYLKEFLSSTQSQTRTDATAEVSESLNEHKEGAVKAKRARSAENGPKCLSKEAPAHRRLFEVDEEEDVLPSRRTAQSRATAARKASEEQRDPGSVPSSSTPVTSFMPKRKEFLVAFDNDDDDLVGSIDFNVNDRDMDKRLKEEILRSYHAVVRQRQLMTDFAIERKLTDPVTLQFKANSQPLARLHLETASAFAARFLEASEFDRFVSGQLREVSLQTELTQLEKMQSEGSSSAAEKV